MPLELAALVDPAHTALVTQECQRGVIGAASPLPDLAEAAARVGMVSNIAKLVAAARSAGATVIHCLAERRGDGLGANRNARIFRYMAKAPVTLLPGSEAAELVPEIPVADSDLVLSRLHGVSPFHGTELDWVLRNEGVQTVVGVGVSVNVAIQNLAFDCVNSGYQIAIPRDAVAGTPQEYVDMVFTHTLPVVATVTTTREILAAWAT